MSNYLTHTIIISILLIMICFNNKSNIREYFISKKVLSGFDHRSYKVVSSFSDSQAAADKLAETHNFMINVMRFLKMKFIINKNGSYQEINFVKRILKNYKHDVLFENDPIPGDETSFVVNKGDKFGICLRKKSGNSSDGEFHKKNTLQFVALHELTHLGVVSFGHHDDYWQWFQFMLRQAYLSKLYKPIDYSRKPINYCGLPVRSNPYF